MNNLSSLTRPVLAVACLSLSAAAQIPFNDSFDAYTVGAAINGQAGPPGGWKQWASAPNTTSVIEDSSSGFARSGRSVSVGAIQGGGTSDLVHEFSAAGSPGQYVLRAYTYAATGIVDSWFCGILNTYSDAGPTWKWSVRVKLDPATMLFTCECGADQSGNLITTQGPLILNNWVEVRA